MLPSSIIVGGLKSVEDNVFGIKAFTVVELSYKHLKLNH